MKLAVELRNVTKRYQGFTLDNVSIQVPAGCIMGFIGENGAGKSTTIKALLGLIEIDEGQVFVYGSEVPGKQLSNYEDIGVVFDNCCFPEVLNIRQLDRVMKNIYPKWDGQTYFSYINKFGLPDNKTIKEFSKGMKTKLSIAVALSHQARLLIMDEPTSGLDPVVRDEILEVFQDYIQSEENTIILSSHISSDLEKISDYITFIHKGKIKFCNAKDEMLETYGLVKCTQKQLEKIKKEDIIGIRKNAFQTEVLVNNRYHVLNELSDVVIEKPTLDDIMLFEIKGEKR